MITDLTKGKKINGLTCSSPIYIADLQDSICILHSADPPSLITTALRADGTTEPKMSGA
jgi:hypothetical protein